MVLHFCHQVGQGEVGVKKFHPGRLKPEEANSMFKKSGGDYVSSGCVHSPTGRA